MSDSEALPTVRKALKINLDEAWYGTFAEIGAGQEVARHFFQAGRASKTIAKTMSAYDMIYSDEIYGKEPSGRYVCESRLLRMLDKEFSLLVDRLDQTRGAKTQFFAFANTVATSTQAGKSTCHGWMGVKFQTRPGGPANEIVLHVNMLDKFRLQQQEALGILGVNLIHAAFYPPEKTLDFISLLSDNIKGERMEIDMIRFSGPDVKHIDNRLMSLELLRQELTGAVVFGSDAQVQQLSDVIFRRDVFIQRGTFRPITNINVDILNRGLEQFNRERGSNSQPPLVFMEITMQNLLATAHLDQQDFLDRVDTLSALGYSVMITNHSLYFHLKNHLRRYTNGTIGIVIGASHLDKLFEPRFYSQLDGGILEGFGKLFDDQTKMYVYPFKLEHLCTTAASWHPQGPLRRLYEYLRETGKIVDIVGCADVLTSLHSENVRQMMNSGDKGWKSRVPEAVVALIEKRKLFGHGTPTKK